MKTYTAEVITEVLTIQANSPEEAELKYNAFYDDTPCPDHNKPVSDCCVIYSDTDTYHNMEAN